MEGYPTMNYKDINEKKLLLLSKKSSDAELYFKVLLESLNIPYLIEHSFSDFVTENGGKYRYDFCIVSRRLGEDYNLPIKPENILCIVEVDGKGHYIREDWEEKDEIKENYLRSNKIPFFRVEHMEAFLNATLLSEFLKKLYFEEAEFYDIKSRKDFIRYIPVARQLSQKKFSNIDS